MLVKFCNLTETIFSIATKYTNIIILYIYFYLYLKNKELLKYQFFLLSFLVNKISFRKLKRKCYAY